MSNNIVRCVGTELEDGRTIYKIENDYGKKINIDERALIYYIKNGKLRVDNLAVTDNKIVQVNEKKIKKLRIIEEVLAKYAALGVKNPFEYDVDDNGIVTITKYNGGNALMYNEVTIPVFVDKIKFGVFEDKHIDKVISKQGLEDCSSLFFKVKSRKLDLTEFSMTRTTSVYNMFHGCNCVEVLFCNNTCKNITDTSNMFDSCSELINLDLKWLDMTSVKNTENMFSGCKNLRTIEFTNFKDTTMKLNNLLSNCRNIISVTNNGRYCIYNTVVAFNYLGILNRANKDECDTKPVKTIDTKITLLLDNIRSIDYQHIEYAVETIKDNVLHVNTKQTTLAELIEQVKRKEVEITNIKLNADLTARIDN